MELNAISVWPFNEGALLLLVFVIILAISLAILTKLAKAPILGVAQLVVGLFGIFQVSFDFFDLRVEDKITGKWKAQNVYHITPKDSISLGRTISVTGIGEQYLLYNSASHSFQGLGWINIGTNATEPVDALIDTVHNDFVTFRIEGGGLSPEKDKKIVFSTSSVHKTLRRGINTQERALCNVAFPPEIKETNWTGRARCSTDSFDVEIEVTLSKMQ